MSKEETKKPSGEKSDRIDKALQKFSEMIIKRMEEMQTDWKKGWIVGKAGRGGLPQNLSGRPYVGSNAFLLFMHTARNGFQAPVYMTIKQIREAGAKINKGEGSIPVFKWGLSIKDENGKRVSEADYKAMSEEDRKKCKVRPYLQVYNEWNIDQTNFAEVNKDKYEAILKRFETAPLKDDAGMYKNAALDRMFEKQEWVCPIEYKNINQGAYYSPGQDRVVVPRKSQFNISDTPDEVFKDGMEYYSSAVHEMAHSTGHKSRLNRLTSSGFGSPEYAKEELVAELTAALVGHSLGFDKRINDNNAAYLKSWIGTLRKEPKFIVSVMSDVNHASKMVLESIDKQRIALGEKPLLEGSLDGTEEKAKNEQQLENIKTGMNAEEGQRALDDAKEKTRQMSFGEPYDYEAYPFGRVEPFLAEKEVDVVNASADHGFTNYKEAKAWAKQNISKIYNNEETGGKGDVRISNAAIDKFLSQSAIEKSDSKDIHMAVLRVLPEILKASIDVETHPDFLKSEDGKRYAKNSINKDVLVHRCYGAASIEGKPYRVKITLKENVKTREATHTHSYEATKIELLVGLHGDVTMTSPRNSNSSTDSDTLSEGTWENPKGPSPNTNNSISAAKLLKNVVMSYNPSEKVLDASEKRSKIIREQQEDIKTSEAKGSVSGTVPTKKQNEMEEKYYYSYQYLQSTDSTEEFDKLQEKQDYKGILLLAAQYDQGDALEQSKTSKNAEQYSGDDILDEDDNYAVVYNNSVGGTYSLMRKVSKEDIIDNIERYGLDSDATDDVKKIAYEKDKKQEQIAVPQEDSNVETNVAGLAQNIAANGVSMTEAEKEAKNIVNTQVSEEKDKKNEREAQEEKRKSEAKLADEQKKKAEQEKPQEDESNRQLAGIGIHAMLIVGALEMAKKNGGVWMNSDRKAGAEFMNSNTPITAYNNMIMTLNAEKNGYKTNTYTYYNPAKDNGTPVKRNQTSLPFSWTNWDYQSITDDKDIIKKEEYNKLPESEKARYVLHASHVMQHVYNIDQTVMSAVNKDGYASLVKEKGAKSDEKEEKVSFEKTFGDFKKSHPDTMLLVRVGDFYETYKDDATTAANILGITLTRHTEKKEENGKLFRTAAFPISSLDTFLPKLIRAGHRIAIFDEPTTRKAKDEKEPSQILASAIKTAEKVTAAMGMNLAVSPRLSNTTYDSQKDILKIGNRQLKPGDELGDAIKKAAGIYRGLAQAVETESRLNLEGRSEHLPISPQQYTSLIHELAAGNMMARQGLPATLGVGYTKNIPVWSKALTDNPKLAHIIEIDVNTAVETIEKLAAGKKVDYSAIRGEAPIKTTSTENTVKDVLITTFQAIKDDAGHYAFYIKPKDEPGFSVYPKREHLNDFFNALKTPERESVHTSH